MNEPQRCKACGWENADAAQTELIGTLTEQGFDTSMLPTAYLLLGPKPEHTCGRAP